MPDTKITSARIREHLRRMWALYLVGAVLALFFNHLIFTVTRPSFSEDETLKIMLLNADLPIDAQAMLEATEHLGFRTVETLPLAVSYGDPSSEMLLLVQLTGGFGDLCITDSGGMDLLQAREACLDGGTQLPGGLFITAMKNSTTPGRAQDALPILFQMIAE